MSGSTTARDRFDAAKRITRRLLPFALAGATVPSVIRLVGDHDLPWPVMVVSFVPVAAFAVLVLGVLALALGQRVVAGVAALVVALNAFWLAPLYVSDDPPRDGTRITAMTSNLLYGWADVGYVVDQVRRHNVDVLGLTELTPEAEAALEAAGIDKLLPHHVADPAERAHGSGLWSRWPLTPAPAWDGGIHRWPGATARIDGREVTFRVVHPFRTSKFNATSYRADYRLLRARMNELHDGGTPALVMGDFNASRDHSAFRRVLGKRWRDATEYAGSGLTPTWNLLQWLPPVIQLDHILMSPHFGARSARTLDIPGTDHHAVLADLVLAPR
jgi:endonuclease/exonuclease/phosphatase family metal-dependent hydrolase